MNVQKSEPLLELERRKNVAEGLRDILAVLNSNQSLDAILDYIVTCAKQLLYADAAAIYRLQPEGSLLTVQASHGLSEEYLLHSSLPLGKAATGRAVLEGLPVSIDNVKETASELGNAVDPDISNLLNILSKRFGAVLAVPLIIKNEKVGALTLYYTHPRIFDQEELGLAVSFCDQAALAIENARLQDKIQEDAVEAERNRIARDLHDSVTQTIFSASLIAEVLPTVWARSPQEAEQGLSELRQLTRGALAEMRTLLLELRPAGLKEAKLDDLLKQLGEGVAGRIRAPVEMHIDGQFELPSDVKLAFYRVAQETFNNLAKHSGAGKVEVELKATPQAVSGKGKKRRSLPQTISMTIRDNGCGFNLDAVSSEHMGLGIMRERASNVHASFFIKSSPGQGTETILIWSTATKE